MTTSQNTLFYGDNLEILRNRKYLQDETVDLCYIDPPFNSKRNYNQIYNNIGGEDRAQAQAFIDTWVWDEMAGEGFTEILANDQGRFTSQTVDLIKGLEVVLKKGSLLAYLVSMTLRITEIHRVLKPTGSFYLHCDPTASHYLKLVLDAVFVVTGGDYRNEIAWKRADAHNDAKRQFGYISDRIFFYTKSSSYTFHKQHDSFQARTLEDWYQYVELADGTTRRMTKQEKETQIIPNGARRFNTSDLRSPNPRPNLTYDYKGYKPHQNGWALSLEKMEELDAKGLLLFPATPEGRIMRKRYLDESLGPVAGDVWTDISQLRGATAEKLGYPTQKPEALLERIIKASTDPGDLVLDAYCGCGTTIAVAEKLGRKWIGIDITYQSISLILRRLEAQFGKSVLDTITLNGVPKDMASAQALALKKDDRVRKEFEKWAVLTYSNNRAIINDKKGGDKGIDGIAYFMTGANDNAKIVFQVKSGTVGRGDISKLNNDRTREKAELAIFLTLQPPTAGMTTEAGDAGFYQHQMMGRNYPRIQIVTIADMVEQHKRLEIPMSLEVLKKAQAVATQEAHPELFDMAE